VLVSSLAASAGAVLWMSRGSALLASMMVSTPAWRGYDLLPVLGQTGRTPATLSKGSESGEKSDDKRHRAKRVAEALTEPGDS
jgi:hypothetical protein